MLFADFYILIAMALIGAVGFLFLRLVFVQAVARPYNCPDSAGQEQPHFNEKTYAELCFIPTEVRTPENTRIPDRFDRLLMVLRG